MYEPAHFRIEDRAKLLETIRAHPLGVLVSAGPSGLMANPVPFIVAEDAAGAPVLRAHLARANQQWREFVAGGTALVVFQGAEHYISPGWYETKRETGKVVPTWNYVHVQVRGPARVHEGAEFLRPQIEALTSQHEGPRAESWKVDDAPEPFIAAQMRGIVGLEIAIESIAGKFKLSQNRNAADFAGVVAGLEAEPDSAGPDLARIMRDITA